MPDSQPRLTKLNRRAAIAGQRLYTSLRLPFLNAQLIPFQEK